MEDQTNFLRKFGISAGSIGEDKARDLKIKKGECSVVFSSPESLVYGHFDTKSFRYKSFRY